MKLSIEYQGEDTIQKATAEISNDSDIFEVFDSICGLLVSYGFHHSSVRDGILDKAEKYNEEEKKDE